MACYLCRTENVTTDADSECVVCNRFTCSFPPSRRDGRFHGEECTDVMCRKFVCERHMHDHPQPGTAISTAFPRTTIAIATEAVAATANLEHVYITEDAVGQDASSLAALNRYLNCISPGTTALAQSGYTLPYGIFHVHGIGKDTWVQLHPGFFKRPVTETVARMALRSMWTAGTVLGAHRDERTMRTFKTWTGTLALPTAQEYRHHEDSITWLADVLKALPARPEVLHADFSELPAEESPYGLIQLLVQRYGESEGSITATTAGV